jgi:hypothetical protein
VTVGEQFVQWENLIPGKRYKVTLSDCCIDGHFTSTFVQVVLDEDGTPDRAVFIDGKVEPGWSFGGAIDFEEVDG